jgi:hypothetical protein
MRINHAHLECAALSTGVGCVAEEVDLMGQAQIERPFGAP